jgi:hypothetical protein
MMLDLSLNFSRNRMVDGGGETIRNGSKPMNKQHDKMVEAATKWLAKNDTVGMSAQQAMSGFAEPFATALSAANEEIERLKEVLTSVEKTLYSVGVEMYRVQGKITKALADTPLTGE